jgi:hypothetical protein
MEAQRELEQRALRNVRGLVDRLDGEEGASRKRQRVLVAWAVLPAVLFLGFVGTVVGPKPNPEAVQAKCELDAWTRWTADVERRMRDENPGVTHRQVLDQIGLEKRPFIEATARKCAQPG